MATLYVGGLPDGIDDESFSQLFEGSGEILSCTCYAEQKYGYVKYASKDDAQAVVEAMNGFQFGDSNLQVKFDDTPAWPAGGGKGAGGGDKGWGKSDKGDKGDKGWGKGGKGGKDGKGGKGGKDWGGDGGKGGKKSWTPVAAEPSDNLYIKGLPEDATDDQIREIFACYATVVSCKVLKHANESSLLLRVGNVEMATWIVENLNGNIPQGLSAPVQVRYADTPGSKAAKLQQMQGVAVGGGKDGGFGAAKGKGKGKGKGGPYGDFGGKGAQFGNFDPTLPPEVQNSVECVLRNFGAGSKQRFAPAGDESNLYVKDLPGTADELYIYKVFSPFGALDSITLKKGENDAWAIAFVKFITNEEAQAAVIGLTNCLLPDGSMLKVSVKTQNPNK